MAAVLLNQKFVLWAILHRIGKGFVTSLVAELSRVETKEVE